MATPTDEKIATMHDELGNDALARINRLSPMQKHYALVHLAGVGEGTDEMRRALDFAETVQD
jgi:hypothetical protein